MDETVSGYKNSETFQFIATKDNVRWLTDQVIDFGVDQVRADPEVTDYDLGQATVVRFKERYDTLMQFVLRRAFMYPAQREALDHLHVLREAVGSWWRIDYREVGESMREDIASALRGE